MGGRQGHVTRGQDITCGLRGKVAEFLCSGDTERLGARHHAGRV